MALKVTIANIIKPTFLYYYYRNKSKFHVHTIEDTILKIITDKCSMIRFGDFELNIILGKNTGYQDYDEKLAEGLKQILRSTEEKLLICIPDVFEGLEKYKGEGKLILMYHLATYRKEWENICKNKFYYNAFVSRPYIGAIDKDKVKSHFEKIKKIWDNENVILVEGRYSRFGCGNDLFYNVATLKRVLCPEKNAYTKYDEILKEVMKQDEKNLILVSLGPTAKLLTYDLFKNGRRALDVGHIDIEYEWFLRKAEEKICIPGKYVYEVPGGDKGLDNFNDEKYEREVTARILA